LSSRNVPVATLALIAVCLVAAFFTLTNSDAILRWGYVPQPLAALSAGQRVISALTSLFVHLDPLHLLGNMLFLAAVGPAVERAVGAWKMLLVFVVSGLVGVAAHHLATTTVLNAVSGEALAGSSAAIAGLIGYAWLRFRLARVPLLPNLWVPVWGVILVWVLLQVGGAWFSARQFGAPVAYFAHLFGFASGFLLGFPLGAAAGAADEAWRDHLAEAANRGPSAQAAILKGRDDLESLSKLAAVQEESGNADEAAGTYARLAAADPLRDGGLAVTKLASIDKLDLISRPDRLRAADRAAHASPDIASLLLDSLVAGGTDDLTAAALERLVDLQAGGPAARSAARRLFADFSLSPEAERVRNKYPDLAT
jgi:membrane associated rhomboid family serine protease